MFICVVTLFQGCSTDILYSDIDFEKGGGGWIKGKVVDLGNSTYGMDGEIYTGDALYCPRYKVKYRIEDGSVEIVLKTNENSHGEKIQFYFSFIEIEDDDEDWDTVINYVSN